MNLSANLILSGAEATVTNNHFEWSAGHGIQCTASDDAAIGGNTGANNQLADMDGCPGF